ncbi:MAG: tetratricopeptide repeat protein [Candidatus Rokubacteria bacterium]|nr:tetratricopeptide repeat protein [Candidatus Rokubacteria bacterium]
MRRLSAGVLAVALLAGGCAGLPVVAPPSGPAQTAPTLDAEAQALARVETYDDPLLAEYLATIADRLAGEEERESGAAPVTITVLRDPTINAFALPDGRVYVHTGLLSRLANEAQLAAVLARELTHARRRHGLLARASEGDVTAAIAALAPALTAAAGETDEAAGRPLSPVASAILGGRLTHAYTAAFTGHGRELERAADAGALERLVRAAWDPKEAPRAFERLRREARAGGVAERFHLGNDAALADRVESTQRLVTAVYAVAAALPDTNRETEDFEPVLAPMVRENARLELRAGRLRAAQAQLDRVLAHTPGDGRAYLYYGDLHRVRAQRARSVADRDELARRALAAYERAAALDPALGEVSRQVGLLYYQQGRVDRAREAFEQYITRNPDAPDVARVREYVRVLTP